MFFIFKLFKRGVEAAPQQKSNFSQSGNSEQVMESRIFNLDLFNESSANIGIFANSGWGKTYFFNRIISAEHAKHGSNIKSIVFCNNLKEYDKHQHVAVSIIAFKINPFAIYNPSLVSYEERTNELITLLIKNIAAQLLITWTDYHQTLLDSAIKAVIYESRGSMKALYTQIVDKFELVGKLLAGYFKGNDQEMLFVDFLKIPFIPGHNFSELTQTNDEFKVLLEMVQILNQFVDPYSPYSIYFGEDMVVPSEIERAPLVLIEKELRTDNAIESAVAILSLYFLEQHVEQKTKNKNLAVYHDIPSLGRGTAYYQYLYQFTLKAKYANAGVRIAVDSFPNVENRDWIASLSSILVASTIGGHTFYNTFEIPLSTQRLIRIINPFTFYKIDTNELVFHDLSVKKA